jgi:type II secretory pathway pseudopilin PulG
MKNSKSGFTIIEILIGTSLLAFAVSAIVQVISFQHRVLKTERIEISKNRTLASLFETLRKVAKYHQNNFDGVDSTKVTEVPASLSEIPKLPFVFGPLGGIEARPALTNQKTAESGIFWGYQIDQVFEGVGASRKATGLLLVRVRVVELLSGSTINDKVYYLYVSA